MLSILNLAFDSSEKILTSVILNGAERREESRIWQHSYPTSLPVITPMEESWGLKYEVLRWAQDDKKHKFELMKVVYNSGLMGLPVLLTAYCSPLTS